MKKTANAMLLRYRGKSDLVKNLKSMAAFKKIKNTYNVHHHVTEGVIIPIDPTIRLTATVDIYVEDHESFSSNETTRRQNTNSAILSARGIPQAIMNFDVRMGGEIRLELALTGMLMGNDGNAYVTGEIKLFEGTSESTGDLDGQRNFALYCPMGSVANYFVRIDNDDEGDDYATVQLTLSNQRL